MGERLRVWLVLIVPLLAIAGVIGGMRYGASYTLSFANVYVHAATASEPSVSLWVETVFDEDGELQRRARSDLDLQVQGCGVDANRRVATDELGAAAITLPRVLPTSCVSLNVEVRQAKETLLHGVVHIPEPTASRTKLELLLPAVRTEGEVQVFLPTLRVPVDALTPLWVYVKQKGIAASGAEVRITEEAALGEGGGRVHHARTCSNGLALLQVQPIYGVAPLSLEVLLADGEKASFFGPLRTQPGAMSVVTGVHTRVHRPTRDGVTSMYLTDAQGRVGEIAYSQTQDTALAPPRPDMFLFATTLPAFYTDAAHEPSWVRWPLRTKAWTCEEASALILQPAYAPDVPKLALSGRGNGRSEAVLRRKVGFAFAFVTLALGAFAEIALLMLGARRTSRLLTALPTHMHDDRVLERALAVLVMLLLFALIAGYITIRVRG